jgi:hypothetical protein
MKTNVSPDRMGPGDHSDKGLRGDEGKENGRRSPMDERALAGDGGGGTDVGVTLGTLGKGLLGGRELQSNTRNQSMILRDVRR